MSQDYIRPEHLPSNSLQMEVKAKSGRGILCALWIFRTAGIFQISVSALFCLGDFHCPISLSLATTYLLNAFISGFQESVLPCVRELSPPSTLTLPVKVFTYELQVFLLIFFCIHVFLCVFNYNICVFKWFLIF